MTRTRIRIKRALVNLISFLMIFCVIGFALNLITHDVPQVLKLLMLLPIFFALLAVRLLVDNIFAFLLLHIFIALFPMLVFDGMLRVFSIILMSLSSIFSIVQRFKGEWEITSGAIYFLLVPISALTIIGQLSGVGELTNVYIAVAFVIMVCYLLYSQIGSIDKSLEFSAKESLQPISGILRFNNRIITFFIMIVVGGGLLTFVLPFDRVVRFAANILLTGLRSIFGLLFGNEPEPVTDKYFLDEVPIADDPIMPITDEGSKVLYNIGMVFYYIMTVAVIVGIIALILYALLRFYKAFYGTKKTGYDIKEFVTPEIEMDMINRTLDKIKRRLSNSPHNKLRRRYYKKINSHIAKGAKIKISHTANDIAEQLRQQENIDDLTKQYETARYGREL